MTEPKQTSPYLLPPGTTELSIAFKEFLKLLQPYFSDQVSDISVEEDSKGDVIVKISFNLTEKNS